MSFGIFKGTGTPSRSGCETVCIVQPQPGERDLSQKRPSLLQPEALLRGKGRIRRWDTAPGSPPSAPSQGQAVSGAEQRQALRKHRSPRNLLDSVERGGATLKGVEPRRKGWGHAERGGATRKGEACVRGPWWLCMGSSRSRDGNTNGLLEAIPGRPARRRGRGQGETGRRAAHTRWAVSQVQLWGA